MPEAGDTWQTYKVDMERLAKAFPAGQELPKLLASLAGWMEGKPWQSIGSFDLAPQWCDCLLPGSEFHYDDFALFIRLPEGSAAGYWLAGGDVENAPIVLLGSEGEYKILAPNLETFLARIALGDFGESGPETEFLYPYDDYDREDDDPGDDEDLVRDLRGDLLTFLKSETGIENLESLTHEAKLASQEFAAWAQRCSETYQSELKAHPAIVAMTPILEKYRPLNAQPWEGARITITWAGDDFSASLAPDGQRAFDEAEKIRPYLAALRDEAAQRKPGLGLWNSAVLTVYENGLYLMTEYIYEPSFGQSPPSAEAFRADQARAPREARRIPGWLAKILAS